VTRRSDGAAAAVAAAGSECYLATAFHVVDGAADIRVAPWATEVGHGAEQSAKIFWSDPTIDAAVLVTSAASGCQPAKMMTEGIDLASPVYLLGQPEHNRGALSHGVVSASWRLPEKGRTLISDAPVGDGFSGGGVFDEAGELVGVTLARGAQADFPFTLIAPVCAIAEHAPDSIRDMLCPPSPKATKSIDPVRVPN
jgi:serine protease Do